MLLNFCFSKERTGRRGEGKRGLGRGKGVTGVFTLSRRCVKRNRF